MPILQPREERFYGLFEAAAANVRQGAEQLLAMVSDYTDVAAKAKAIKNTEHTGDDLTHETYDLLNRIFVTPLDREDIAAIASALDDVLDLVEAAAADFVLCGIETPLPFAVELAQIIARSAAEVEAAVACLRHMSRQRVALRDRLTEINRLENEGDTAYNNAVQALFRETDALLILKWKQVYDHLERAIDSCEDVADVLHGVLLKYG